MGSPDIQKRKEYNGHEMIRRNYIRFAAGAMILIVALSVARYSAQTAVSQVPVYGYQVVHTYPHDPTAFTQGLIFLDGVLYESTGLNNRSSLRKVQLETGKVLQQQQVPGEYFAEGLVNWGPDLLQLTWRSKIGFVYDRATFAVKRRFSYTGEGWGLTKDSARIILSDGSSTLRFLDPKTLQQTGSLNVSDRGRPVTEINELEYVQGEIWANIWQTERIARISPFTGNVGGWIDLKGLLKPAEKTSADVLNGIAYDSATNRIFVTGKLWPKLFEIKLVPPK
jgi:glutamine cyclotransferase